VDAGQVVAGTPSTELVTPAAVQAVANGRRVRPVWENELGGITFEVGTDPQRCFVKWTPPTSGINLSHEVVRLSWAVAFTSVPRLLSQGADEAGSWIVTAALPGESAVSHRWKADPARAVRALGMGLRALHEALPVPTCPFSWSVEHRLDEVRGRAAAGRLHPDRWHESHWALDVSQALDVLADSPPVDQLVVCHGDACAPNTLLLEDGRLSGHVDLGELGVADRWADLAVATWSTQWNYGPGWDGSLLAAYGVDPDPERIAYYRLLWDLGP
jgi:aminoglycoside phosphotransferase